MNKDYNSTPKIEILPEHIIDQIKAGEVLERPASLIKELIENSLDAGSTEICIHLVENGLDLLSIEDNGHGMRFESLPFAFVRHATSKLRTYEDLFHLQSFGFRGEALASVASSARLTCTSQPVDLKESGGKIIINGGAQELLIPYHSGNQGTSLYIKDLFYNTPARLKFIKSKASERSALKKMLYAFALSNPQTLFSIKWDEKEKEIFKPVLDNETSKRIEQVFFSKFSKEKNNHIWNTTESYLNYKVEIYFTPETYSTPQYRHHYLFANNRFFQDKSLHLSILRTLEPIWRLNENGHYVVKITVPPHEMDVNVHPNKTQIKFLKSDIIYSLLVTALRNALKLHKNEPSSLLPAMAPNSFFSREENQSLNLINMNSNQNELEFHEPTFAIKSSSSSILGFISESIVIVTFEQKLYLGDVKKIIASYISFGLEEFIKNGDPPGPLLISEPFKIFQGKIDSHFDDLKNIGFEFDRLNSDVIVLRTLPSFVPQNISRDITLCLLEYFKQNKTSQCDSLLLKKFIEINWNSFNSLSTHTLENVLKNIFTHDNLRNYSLVLLEEKNVRALLK